MGNSETSITKTRKTLGRVMIGIAAAMVILVVAATVVGHSQAFNRFLLAKIVQQAEQSTGARVQIQRMNIAWSPFVIDFYGLVAHGSEADSQSPLLSAEHLRVGLTLGGLLKHNVNLREIALDGPRLNVRVDARGNSNLPRSAKAGTASKSNVSIGRVSVQNGALNYNDQKIPLEAELNDFRLQANSDVATGGYRGTLSYDHGWLMAENLNRFGHNARIDFQANRERLDVHPLVLSVGASQITVNATLTQFDHPKVNGSYDGSVEVAELGHILKDPSLPVGQVRLSGILAYRDQAGQSFLEALQLSGKASSRELGFYNEPGQVRLTDIAGSYKIENGNLRIESLKAAVFGGRMSSSGQIALAGTSSSGIDARIRDVSLSQMSGAVPARDRENMRLAGRVNADVHANWAKTIRDLVGRAHMDIAGPSQATPAAREIPVNGTVDVTYDRLRETTSFRPSHLRTGESELTLSGEISHRASLNVVFDSRDLHELSAMLWMLSPAGNGGAKAQTPSAYDVYGAAQFNGNVSGSISAPKIHGDITASALQVQGSKWKILRATIDASPSRVAAQNGLLQSEGPGQINFNVQTGLRQWTYTPSGPLSIQASWKKLSVADLEHLAHVDYPIGGTLSGDISIQGSQLQPTGHGTLNLVQASLWNQPINSVSADFKGDKDTIHSNANVKLAAGTATAQLTYSLASEHYQVKVSAPNLRLEQMQALQRSGSRAIKGTLTLNAEGEGTAKEPQLHATADVPHLQAGGQTLSQLHAQMDVAQQRAQVTLSTSAGEASVQAKADVTLSGNYPTVGNVEIHGAPVAALMASYLPSSPSGLSGTMDLRGTLNGPLKTPQAVQASLEIPVLKLGYQSVQIANEGPLRFAYRDGTVAVQQARLKGSGTDISMQGAVPATGQAPIDLAANGVIDVSLLQLLSTDMHSSGQVNVRVQARGKLSDPAVEGQVQIVNASIGSESLPVNLTAANGVLDISGNRIDIRQFQGKAGGGTISSQGAFTLGKVPTFAVTVYAKGIRIHPNGIHSTLDGNLQLNGSTEKAQLSGKVVVDHLSFQQGSDLATIIGQFSGTPTASTPSAFEANTKLNISVQSSNELSVANSQFSIAGSANLTVTNTLADPVILGRIALTGGEVFFLSKRFELQNGTIAFSNPVKTEPVLNLFVNTKVEQYDITVNLLGPVDRLKTNYTSEPSLPPLDIINLLAFGQTTAERASNAATPASMGAESVVAQGVAGQAAKGIQSLTGISQLTLDPLAGNNQNPGAQIAIQHRVSGNLLFTFSTNVTSTQNQAVQLEYQAKRQVTISVLRDEYGGYGFDVKWHKIF
jgi:translocation and assembly module TamB